MIDTKLLKDDPGAIRTALEKRGVEFDLNGLLELDAQRRAGMTEIQHMKQERNAISEQVGRRKKESSDVQDLMDQAKALGQRIKDLEETQKTLDRDFTERIQWLPNIPHESVPIGRAGSDNIYVRGLQIPPPRSYQPLPHWEIGEALDILDLKRAAKISGSRFLVLKGPGARLERALINFFLDLHTKEHGYTEILPPVLNNQECLYGTGQLPKLEEDMYKCQDDALYLCPTAEVPLTNLHRDEILLEKELPKKYVAYTPCFRREAGSYGKDVRGIKRVHQFNKVELVKYATPECGYEEFEGLLRDAEKVARVLDLPYRIMLLCTGDMTYASAKTYDIEVYSYGMKEWLEVSSVSIYEQYQARRANIRFRSTAGRTDHVHTMNGSGFALPRVVIAILENYQTEDGRIKIPDVLQPYMDNKNYLE
ncbi:serine--tRNA ligase [candidate division WOR-3 bacterium]|nr:serine--tRNA ligase [candidate division WOR-3 bacterium]